MGPGPKAETMAVPQQYFPFLVQFGQPIPSFNVGHLYILEEHKGNLNFQSLQLSYRF